jgi:flagellar hook-associated protein 3 FlgL
MTDRIASTTIMSSVLRDINESYATLQRSGEQLASGRTLTRPSDNPVGAARAIGLQSTLDGYASYAGNVREALAWQRTATSAMTTMQDATLRVRTLVLGALSGSDSKQNLEAIAEATEQMTQAIKQAAGAKYAGQYIFSGTKSTTAPYGAGAGEYAYQGNEGKINRAIAPGVTVELGVPAVKLLGNGPESGDGKLLDVLATITKELREGTPEALNALRTTGLGGLETNEQAMVDLQAHVGAIVNQLSAAEGTIEEVRQTTSTSLSNVRDANLAEVATEYSSQQVAYETAMRAGSGIIQMSLMDFLK